MTPSAKPSAWPVLLILNALMYFQLLVLLNTSRNRVYVGPREDIESEIGPCKVGDTVPDIEFIHSCNCDTVKLSDFKGKFVILDFWATWCENCIEDIPRLDALQNEFPDEIQILLVNVDGDGDVDNKITESFKKKKLISKATTGLITVNSDIACALFPRQGIPHYVWINTEGKVIAITDSKEITKENIHRMLNGDKISSNMMRE
jgi:thiol-disulfide isomerase/thioredoxin